MLKVFSKGRSWGKKHVFYMIGAPNTEVFPMVYLWTVGKEELITNVHFQPQMGSCTQKVAIVEGVAAALIRMCRYVCCCSGKTLQLLKLTEEIHLKLCVKFIYESGITGVLYISIICVLHWFQTIWCSQERSVFVWGKAKFPFGEC